MRFARDDEDLDQILALRYEVFNLEMNKGMETSHATMRDLDEYDELFHHLLVLEKESGRVVGTYRMQTYEMAKAGRGFYSNIEFDLSRLQDAFLEHAVELGRACVAREHRNGRVLYHLWRGICRYLVRNNKRYFFGCCSLDSQDPSEAKRLAELLEENRHFHSSPHVRPQPGFKCYDKDFRATDTEKIISIPTLMQLYLNHGVKICSEPAIDRIFKTIDFLGVFDVENASSHTRNCYSV